MEKQPGQKKNHYHMHASAKKHPSIKKMTGAYFSTVLPYIPALFILYLSFAHRAKTTRFSIRYTVSNF